MGNVQFEWMRSHISELINKITYTERQEQVFHLVYDNTVICVVLPMILLVLEQDTHPPDPVLSSICAEEQVNRK